MIENLKKIENFGDAIINYQQTSSCYREEKRELWGKILLLSSAILGFSVTMFSNDYLSMISPCLLQFGWVLFLINILCGLFLLKQESEFERMQSLANLARKWDETDMVFPLKTQHDKDKFLSLLYLHDLRTIPENELPFSQFTTAIFEKNKKILTSWKMVKDPEKFYSYSHMKIVNTTSNCFYRSFVLAIIFLVASVIF